MFSPKHLFACATRVLGATTVLYLGQLQAAPATLTNTSDSDASKRLTLYAERTFAATATERVVRTQVLNQVLEQRLLLEALGQTSAAQIQDYYVQHSDRWVQPEAIAVWRLLVATENEALELLAQIQRSVTPVQTWTQLVRDRSLDKATHFRQGSLGYVRPDGNTDVPQVRSSATTYAIARALRDGELSPRPTPDGAHWALIWRRGSRSHQAQSLEQATPQIRQQLALAQARTLRQTLITQLRGQHLSEHHPELLDQLLTPAEPEVSTNKPELSARASEVAPTPRKTDLGDR